MMTEARERLSESCRRLGLAHLALVCDRGLLKTQPCQGACEWILTSQPTGGLHQHTLESSAGKQMLMRGL